MPPSAGGICHHASDENAGEHRAHRAADGADGEADGGEDAGELGDVEGGRLVHHGRGGLQVAGAARDPRGGARVDLGSFAEANFSICSSISRRAFLYGRPERLADADGVVDDARDGRVPVRPLPVVEDAVAPDHQVVGVAVGEGGRDVIFSPVPRRVQLAVGEVACGCARQRRVLARRPAT